VKMRAIFYRQAHTSTATALCVQAVVTSSVRNCTCLRTVLDAGTRRHSATPDALETKKVGIRLPRCVLRNIRTTSSVMWARRVVGLQSALYLNRGCDIVSDFPDKLISLLLN
jgi:hypothetical protein